MEERKKNKVKGERKKKEMYSVKFFNIFNHNFKNALSYQKNLKFLSYFNRL